VYWVNGDGTVRKTPTGGGTTITLASGQNAPTPLVADFENVYWANTTDLVQLPLSGGTPVTLTTLATANFYGIAVDGSTVYGADDGNAVIEAVPIGGGTVATLATAQTGVDGVATNGSSVFWALGNSLTGTVMSIPVGGTTMATVASSQNVPIALVADSATVYFANQGDSTAADGSIVKIPMGGGTPVTLASGQDTPTAIVQDSSYVYWNNYGAVLGVTAALKVPINGGSVVTLSTQGNGIVYNFIAVDSQSVYFTSSLGGVAKAPK
jgi:hypothetical protein